MSPLFRLAASLILAATLTGTAGAQQITPAGTLLTVAGKQVPLPGGGWRIAATADPGSVPLATTVLVRGDGARVTDLIVVRFNPRPREAIFAGTRECGRDDVYFAAIRYDTPSDGYCQFGNLVLPDWNGAPSPLAEAVLALRRAGFLLPGALMQVGVRARTREHVLDVRYYFALPDSMTPAEAVAGGWSRVARDWSQHSLSPTRLEASPQLRLRAAQMAAWADLLQGEIEEGLRGRLDATAEGLPLPWDGQAVGARRAGQARGQLDALLAAGEIDRSTYDAAIIAIEAALLEPETQGMSLWVRSLWKVGTYRVAGTIDSLIVGGFFMDLTQSAAVTFVSLFMRPATLYLNEILWAGSGVGRPAASLIPVDFPEIGANRAR
jgi:hypothetical protein